MAAKKAPAYRVPISRYVAQKPFAKQLLALLLPHRAILYGGGAAGGKSSAILMAALQYADEPGASLILRRVVSNLTQPGALIGRSKDWLDSTDANWNGTDKIWRFPSGFELKFGHMENEEDKRNYASGEYQTICVEESTECTETQLQFIFSRQRKPAGSTKPLRLFLATNPLGVSHTFHAKAFGLGDYEGKAEGIGDIGPERLCFLPSLLGDNPHVDQVSYRESLAALPAVEREALEHGDWKSKPRGDLVETECLRYCEPEEVPEKLRDMRIWDFASTDKKKADFTASCRSVFDRDTQILYVIHGDRFQAEPAGVEKGVEQRAEEDGRGVEIFIFQDPGSAGKIVVSQFDRRVLKHHKVTGIRESGPKRTRWVPVRGAIEKGRVVFVRGRWNKKLVEELEALTTDERRDEREHRTDDFMDTLSASYNIQAGIAGGHRIVIVGGR